MLMNKSVDFSHIPPQTTKEHPHSNEGITLKTRTAGQTSLLTAHTWELYSTEEELQSWWLVKHNFWAAEGILNCDTENIICNEHLHYAIL